MVQSVDLKPVYHEPALTTKQRSEVASIPSHSRLWISIPIPFSLPLILVLISRRPSISYSLVSRENSRISLLHLLVL